MWALRVITMRTERAPCNREVDSLHDAIWKSVSNLKLLETVLLVHKGIKQLDRREYSEHIEEKINLYCIAKGKLSMEACCARLMGTFQAHRLFKAQEVCTSSEVLWIFNSMHTKSTRKTKGKLESFSAARKWKNIVILPQIVFVENSCNTKFRRNKQNMKRKARLALSLSSRTQRGLEDSEVP